jgi:hypothetical protein
VVGEAVHLGGGDSALNSGHCSCAFRSLL